jgi:hypothetical protein
MDLPLQIGVAVYHLEDAECQILIPISFINIWIVQRDGHG